MTHAESYGQNAYENALKLLSILFEKGISQCYVSPGSRSTALVLAAHSIPELQKTVVLDERGAAFRALGFAKYSGTPAILICTSGTAVANYLPAIIEAWQSRTPVIILSADRPAHLRHSGAPQTINQVGIFGQNVDQCIDLDFYSSILDKSKLDDLADTICQAAIVGNKPIHINLQFDKPLEPQRTRSVAIGTRQKPQPTSRENSHLPGLKGEKWVLVGGPLPPLQTSAARGLLKLLEPKIPCFVEPSTNAGRGNLRNWEPLLRMGQLPEELCPDGIIRLGRYPSSKALQLFLERNSTLPCLHFTADDAPDDPQFMENRQSIDLKQESVIPEVDTFLSVSTKFLEVWKNTLNGLSSAPESSTLTDGDVHRYLSRYGNSATFMVSNSFPVRDMCTFGLYPETLICNRGASGIDGITSTAIGIADNSKLPVILLTGDLAFLHDASALLAHLELREKQRCLKIVIIDNGGGGIFSMLPIQQQDKQLFEKYFRTPAGVDVSKIGAGFDIPVRKISRKSDLSDLKLDLSLKGIEIVHVETDHQESMKQRSEYWKQSIS